MKKQVQLSDHFTYSHLLRFTLPSIGMMIFTSIYGMVDGFFISNFVGKTAFASVNLIIPFLQILGGVGAMLGVGGSALVAKTLGEGDVQRARRYFTMMMYLMLGTSIFLTVVGIVVLRPVAYLFGATDAIIGDVMTYGTICLVFNTALQAQYTFQSYLIVAEKPQFALKVVVAAGISNMVLDFLFMAIFHMGVAGAAFIFLGVFNGYSQGSSPIMGYHYGAHNYKEMKNVLKKSLIILGTAGVVLTTLAILLARPLSAVFVGYDAELLDMTARAFRICATPFLVMWFNMYTSSFFTALNDGAVSAGISFMRALVLPVICIIVLPMIWELDGVWYSLVASEVLGVLVSLYFMLSKRKKYHY